MKKPCLTCTRVKDPKNCEQKSYHAWREWFITTWDEMRSRYKLSPHGLRK